MPNRLRASVSRRSPATRRALRDGLAVITTYVIAVGGFIIAEIFEKNNFSLYVIQLNALIIIVAVWILIRYWWHTSGHNFDEQQALLVAAHEQADIAIVKFRSALDNPSSPEDPAMLLVRHDPKKSISYMMEGLFNTFNNRYPQDTLGKINFRVTFWTKSYIDNRPTIAFYFNYSNIAPRNMNRRSVDPEVYERYRGSMYVSEGKNRPVCIPDTSAKPEEYHFLAEDQLDDVRSMLIYPVLSGNSILLGAICIGCDRQQFFCEKAKWKDVIEIFAVWIALEMLRLEYAVSSKQISAPF